MNEKETEAFLIQSRVAEGSSLTYRAALYCSDMAYRQRTDDRRRDYIDAAKILKDKTVLLEEVFRNMTRW